MLDMLIDKLIVDRCSDVVSEAEGNPGIVEIEPVSYSSERRDVHVDRTDTGLERRPADHAQVR